MRMQRCALAVSLLCSPLLTTAVFAETIEANPPDDIESMIASLNPGDELILHDGMYVTNERFSIDIAGTESQPIIIRAADGESPHIHRPNASQNLIDIDSADWLVIRGIEFSGGSAGIRISSARDLVFEDNEIYDTADVAFRMNDGGAVYERITVRNNHIHDTNGTGEGMYLGCNEDRCQMIDSLIEGNYVHNTDAGSVSQGDGIEIKEGSYGNIVRDNVIHDTNYPCILTYSTVGNGPANVIERNVMWNCGDHAIQSAADATIRNNIILSAGANGIAMQPHQNGSPSNLTVVHNTILQSSNDGISIRGATGSVVVANNAVFAMSGRAIFVNGDMSMITMVGNVGEGSGVDAASFGDFVDASYAGTPPMNVFPTSGGALVGAGSTEHVVADDFNGTPRMGVADIGAYAFAEGGNPGWMIMPGFKDETAAPPPGDAGPGEEDAGRPGRDAGPGSDAGPGTDGGPSGSDAGGEGGGGGGCAAASGSSGALLFLLLVARRRRHQKE